MLTGKKQKEKKVISSPRYQFYLIVFVPLFIFFHFLIIALSVLLLMASGYPCGIFKVFLMTSE